GGVYNYVLVNETVNNCIFNNNSANSNGGGMYNYNMAVSTVTNCVFSGNLSKGAGGGISNYPSYNSHQTYPTIKNSTFTKNSANIGGGIYIGISATTLTSCLLWQNTAGTSSEVYSLNSNSIVRACNIMGCGGSGLGWRTFLGTDGGGNIDAD